MSDSILYNSLEQPLTGYKVACREGKKSFSPATNLALQRIRYRLNRETRKAPNEFGPFALFATLEQARQFGEKYGNVILLVEYVPSNEDCLWKCNPPSFKRGGYGGRGYHAVSNGTTDKPLWECPHGTILADSVFVLEVVEEC